jgi:hypothetical protein
MGTLILALADFWLLVKVLVSCRLSTFKLPPMLALMVLAETTAPMTLVSPPLVMVAVLPAETLVFVKVVSCPSLLPLPRLTEALALMPWALKLAPMLLELELLVLVWLNSFLAASRLTWLSAVRVVLLPALTLEP